MFLVPLAPDELERRVSFDPRDDEGEGSELDEAALQAWLDEASARPDWSTTIAPLLDKLPAIEADTVELVLAGSKQADLAHIFGATQAAISYRLHRAIHRLKFLVSLPPITDEDLERLPEVLDEISVRIVRAVWRSTSQTVAAAELKLTQGRVRHRFLRAIQKLGEAAKHDPTYGDLHTAMRLISENWNVLNEIVLPQWSDREGDYVVPL